MKRPVFSAFVVLVFAAMCYALFSFNTSEVVSKPSEEGTIKVCWGPLCTTSPQTTVVKLVDANGRTLGSCTITPPEPCCAITGDFPTGTYQIVYYQPTGAGICSTAPFRYVNGTDIVVNGICHCP